MALVRSSHPSIKDLARTQLTADVAASDSSLTVENAQPFAANDYLLIESYDSARAEIVRVSSSAPSGTTINLDSGNQPAFAHTKGATVQVIPYNQVNIEQSTDLETNWDSGAYTTLSAASDASTWADLDTVDLSVSQKENVYNDNTATRRAYRTRFYNEFANVYSVYGDPVLPDGFEGLSVGSIIEGALTRTNQEINDNDNDLISFDFLIKMFNNALNELHYTRKRWSGNSNFDFSLSGEIEPGKPDYSLPGDIDETDTKKSVYNVRVEDGADLGYIDKREYNKLMKGAHQSDLAGALTSGSATIVLDDTSNFPDSGTFTVFTGTTKDEVTFSANNRTTNTLTLPSAATEVTTTHAIDTDVWVSASFGTPRLYTVYEGLIYLYPIPNENLNQRAIEMDYYKKTTQVYGQGDYILFPDPLVIEYYLCMAISERLKEAEERNFYEAKFRERLATLVRNEYTGKKNKFRLIMNTGGNPVRGLRYTGVGRHKDEGSQFF